MLTQYSLIEMHQSTVFFLVLSSPSEDLALNARGRKGKMKADITQLETWIYGVQP